MLVPMLVQYDVDCGLLIHLICMEVRKECHQGAYTKRQLETLLAAAGMIHCLTRPQLGLRDSLAGNMNADALGAFVKVGTGLTWGTVA